MYFFFSLFSSIIFYFYISKYIKFEKPKYLFDQVDADYPNVIYLNQILKANAENFSNINQIIKEIW